MFKSKSFDLNNDDTKLPEHLYQPRRIRWAKYIIIPLGIGFVLLLIICNIDFSTEQSQTNPTYLQYSEWCTTNCESQTTQCNNNVTKLLIETHCIDKLQLLIKNFNFPDGIINNKVFTVEHVVQSLVLRNCSLNFIMDGAFDQSNLNNLLNLKLYNTQLKTLTQKTFQGLHKLRNFSLINNRESTRFESFMTPLARTLHAASIHQQYSENSVYKPSDFFGITIYSNLKALDLRGNNFGDAMETVWFKNMPALKSLTLADCRFNSIDFDISDESFAKLRYLDLSGNQLLKLSAQFISTSIERGIRLMLVNHNKTKTTTTPTPTLFVVSRAVNFDTFNENIGRTYGPPKRTPKPNNSASPSTPASSTLSLNDTDATLDDTDTTTPINEDIPTPSDHINIVCLNRTKDTVSSLSMIGNGLIRIKDHAENAVNIILYQVDYDDWDVVYFSTQSPISYVNKEDANVKSMEDISITVRNLICATSYVFCLLQANETTPFNCQSHHTLSCVTTKSSWFEDNSALVIGLGIAGILISVAIGGLFVFAVLWYRPTWLCGSERLKRTDRNSLTMLLLPRINDKEAYGAIKNENNGDGVDTYVAYYRHLEQAKLYETESNKYNIPPQECAPPAPNPKNHIYECLDFYEELIGS